MIIKFDKKGYINKDYWSVNFYSEKSDYHWRNENNRAKEGINIMFKHKEICDIIKNCLYVEPKWKRKKLSKMFYEAIHNGMELPTDYN